MIAIILLGLSPGLAPAATVSEGHPRILIPHDGLDELAARCAGPLQGPYARAKREADAAVKRGGSRFLHNNWATPSDLIACALVYLVEREAGRAHRHYADVIIDAWGDGSVISNKKGSHFGYHALLYDWIFDALDADQRKRFGDALGGWLTWYTGEAAITLKAGHWEYNQTWGPTHLNVMHSRDAIVQKLFIALAIHGAETSHQADASRFLESWATRIPRDCIPAFDAMGGSWAESHGHGAYGPLAVVPYAFEAWRTATGENLFTAGKPWSFLPEVSRWLTYLQVPHVDRHAYIDDGGGSRYAGFQKAAPMVARALRDPLAQWMAVEAQANNGYRFDYWQIPATLDPELEPRSPGELELPLAHLFRGAGHVFMRSAWDDPDATWAFFGVGQHLAGHQHDDEGHFLISRRGGLVGKGAGKGGGNDSDHYWGGSLAFNIVTIFDPDESFRRSKNNENDGGLLRHVYVNEPVERGHIVAYHHGEEVTYAAADITAGYNGDKAREVTRQFLYLRGEPGKDEFFVVFDRVESTDANFAKHFMLHVPAEPELGGTVTQKVPGHVSEHQGAGLVASWSSRPDDFGSKAEVLSTGTARMFLKTVLPQEVTITKRGGEGHRDWGHPLEPTAQYDHDGKGRNGPPHGDWRLEVAAPPAERSLFLHVFQVADEGVTSMAPVELLEQGRSVRLRIGEGNRSWEVELAADGALAAEVVPPRGDRIRLPTAVEADHQDEHWETVVGPRP